MISVRMSREHRTKLLSHLFASEAEAGAFLLADWQPSEAEFVVDTLLIPDEEDIAFASPYHLAISEDFVGEAIRAAWDGGRCLVEVHCHTDARWVAAFSPSDLQGLGQLVPHIRWRLRGRPYAALVFTTAGFAGLAWVDGQSVPTPIHALHWGEKTVTASTEDSYDQYVGRSDPA